MGGGSMLSREKLEIEIDGVVDWIKEYVNNANVNGVVIGDSGGKDSAVCIALATKALGKERVTAVSMPCHSIESDYDDAKLVADTFGVNFVKVDLTMAYDEMEREINDKLGANCGILLSNEAKINIKPRLRMTTLYGIAQSKGCLVMGTGNMCEIAVGYTTKWGDSASDFNPLANFTVDEVLEIGRILGVPDKIVNKAPNDGLGGLTDEEKMGIKYSQIAEMIETGHVENEEIKANILKRFNNSKHKRNLVSTYKLRTIDRDFRNLENQ